MVLDADERHIRRKRITLTHGAVQLELQVVDGSAQFVTTLAGRLGERGIGKVMGILDARAIFLSRFGHDHF